MIRHVPEIKHLVQAAAFGPDVIYVAASSSRRPKLLARQRVQKIAFHRDEIPLPQSPHNHHISMSSTKRWTDEKLFKRYGLSQEEIAFIASKIRSTEGNDE